MKKKEFWRGVEGVELIWHGEWSDPELRYGNVVANVVDVEECLSSSFEEAMGIEDTWDGNHEEEFSQYCRDNREEVIEWIYSGQTPDNRLNLTYDMIDWITRQMTGEEYEVIEYAVFEYDDVLFEEYEERIMGLVRAYNKKYGLEPLGEEWWKFDYADYHERRNYPNVNFRSLWDMVSYCMTTDCR